MSPALPLIRSESFLEEHRRIRRKLVRMSQYTGRGTGFPTVLSALEASVEEIEGLLPDLAEHFGHEERAILRSDDRLSPEVQHQADRVLGEHRPLIRELRVLWESGRHLAGELRAGRESEAAAQGLLTYLAALVRDLLDHEEAEGTLLAEPAADES